ncbi:unnamed protein product [Prorocentrum cordatum]|uniref:Peptidase S54 rhomboid domain-containing protein n=1 Tax=Prorocentrum cordatum TaxID=2364126 RepID=A0ABN9X2C9_9DINO|nr:unnamed protein product [Polarella glacialis]
MEPDRQLDCGDVTASAAADGAAARASAAPGAGSAAPALRGAVVIGATSEGGSALCGPPLERRPRGRTAASSGPTQPRGCSGGGAAPVARGAGSVMSAAVSEAPSRFDDIVVAGTVEGERYRKLGELSGTGPGAVDWATFARVMSTLMGDLVTDSDLRREWADAGDAGMTLSRMYTLVTSPDHYHIAGALDRGVALGKPAAEARPREPPGPHTASRACERAAAEDVQGLTLTARLCYTILACFAHWFGAARFDADGDGDFDAVDVQAMLGGWSSRLALQRVRPPRGGKARAARRRRAEARKEKQREAGRAEGARAHGGAVRTNGGAGGVTGAADSMVEHVLDGVAGVLEAEVEAEAQEDVVLENLQQRLPYFTIAEAFLCLGLWLLSVLLVERDYLLLAYNQGVTHDLILRTLEKGDGSALILEECQIECTFADAACVGIAWLPGPFPECHLLAQLPGAALSGSGGYCRHDSWDWRVYEKGAFTLTGAVGSKGGAESMWPGRTALRSHYLCQEGFGISFLWRWWSYQFTHGSLAHVTANCFMTLMFGIPLEGWLGTGRMAIMWTLGCLGGACCWALFDPYRTSYGASGGCFSLLGIHIADLLMNWGDRKWRFGTFAMISFICGVESASFWATYDPDGGTTAHCVHVGGLAAGLLISVTVGRNEHWKFWEYVCCCISWCLAIGLLGGSFYFWFENDYPAIANVWDYSERPWCWIGKVCIGDDGTKCPLLKTFPTLATGASTVEETRQQCVFCATRSCVEGWYTKYTADDGIEHQKYCPTASTPSACSDDFTDDWNLFYPPTRSKFQG